ncbi:EAL domain-containing protein (putative c-di-GMP-specific phosphodiesterase class I) [Fibrobacter sp. UWR4]|nr:EAL domain-containing protein (putative c-di-GMP-specific phosphodiesterase class I) [Fibrobacter sp. UWR4]PZW64658.1 EAL domain-containing protein (putative c-di-GMP-specific phosphodiesterase class I) [Fibrobacter sp. UWR1]
MDIQFQTCSLIIIVLILVIQTTHKRLMLRSERIFQRALILTTIMLVLDISTSLCITHIDDIPGWLSKSVCTAFEITLIWCSGIVLVYLMADIIDKKRYILLNKFVLLTILIESLTTMALPMDFNPAGFAEGPAIQAGYGWFVFNFIVTLVFLVKNHNKISRRRRFGIVLWIGIWLILTMTEMLYPQWPLISLAITLGILLLFGLLEKPESKLEKQYGCFNYFALISFLEEMVENQTPISIITVSLKTEGVLSGKNLYEAGRQVLDVLERHGDVWIFRGINQDFISVSKKREAIEEVSADLEREAKQFPKKARYARIIRSYENTTFSSANEILQFLNYLKKRDNEQTRIFDATAELIQSFHNKEMIKIELRNALIENRLEAFFQPIYSVHEKRITSCEALARIRKKDGELLMPSEFIPIAEENGSILELGYKIFKQTCDFLSHNENLVNYVEVNLSVVQCEDEGLAEKLIEIMEEYNIPPKKINLEITETASIVTKQKLLKNMQILLDYGVTFSLDDFGKGESNLMYVVEMPISIVKLDFDMSKSYFKNQKAKYVVNAVENMSHGLNLKLVAEGIESEDELNAMIRQNIDYIQGYYVSKPLPRQEFIDFVQNYNKS